MAARIRKGDQVVVITGSDRGKQGEVLSVLTTGVPLGAAAVCGPGVTCAGLKTQVIET